MAKSSSTTEPPKKLYKGYFNYRILTDKLRALKTYNFMGKTKKESNKLEAQFSNPVNYDYIGKKVVRDRSKEKEKA
jgi:hypothetical protein